MTASIADNYQAVTERMREAARRAGRDINRVTLVAVSKRQPVERIGELATLGHRDFGENVIQAWRGRQLTQPNLRWHLIGPLQTNKAGAIAIGQPALIHSVDRTKLVGALNAKWRDLAPLQVLLQVNIDREPQKSGCLPEQCDAMVDAISAASRLRLRGLMCIPKPPSDRPPKRAFTAMRELLEAVSDRVDGPPELSMGMSGDFEAAIEEGSTIVRVGTALFGPRPGP